jgi:glycosyltransferase involved in cell wall biosynthesis
MNVWIVQMGEPIHLDSEGFRPMRLMNLADSLIEQGHEVTVWTNNFDHFSKKHRVEGNSSPEIQFSPKLRFKLIRSLGYHKNISLRRLLDHIELAIRLSIEIRKLPLPDVCFIGYPPIETAFVVAKYLKKKRVPFAVDVKDDWPEIFVRPFPKFLHWLIRIHLFLPFRMMRFVIKEANALYAPSENFLNHFQKISGRSYQRNDCVVPLTVKRPNLPPAELKKQVDWWTSFGVPTQNKIVISFIGSLTDIFDFEPLLDLADYPGVYIVIAGDGPLYADLKIRIQGKTNVLLPGRISLSQSISLFQLSAASCLPYRDLSDFNSNLPNKFFDCLANRNPIICSDYGLVSEKVSKFNLGFIYSAKEEGALAKVIEMIRINPKILHQFSGNAEMLYENSYSNTIVYGDLVRNLIYLANSRDLPIENN